jgi:hypothetical protein
VIGVVGEVVGVDVVRAAAPRPFRVLEPPDQLLLLAIGAENRPILAHEPTTLALDVADHGAVLAVVVGADAGAPVSAGLGEQFVVFADPEDLALG